MCDVGKKSRVFLVLLCGRSGTVSTVSMIPIEKASLYSMSSRSRTYTHQGVDTYVYSMILYFYLGVPGTANEGKPIGLYHYLLACCLLGR
jgi:hypothetical protein